MKKFHFTNNMEIAYCLQPFHFLQFFLLHSKNRKAFVLIYNSENFSRLFDKFPEIIFISLDERKTFYKELKGYINKLKNITYFYAVPWNKTALKIERLVLQMKGKVVILEDGLVNYDSNSQLKLKKDFYYFLHKIYYSIIGIGYCSTHYIKKIKSTKMAKIEFYSILPSKTSYCKDCKRIPRDNLLLLDKLEKNFLIPNEYKKLPVFFDTNDSEHGWIKLENKIRILKENLKENKILYLPHPFQKHKMSNYLSNLIDVSDLSNSYNELFVYFIKPVKVYTAFSTSVLVLKYLFNLDIEIKLLSDIFYNKTGKEEYKKGGVVLQELLK